MTPWGLPQPQACARLRRRHLSAGFFSLDASPSLLIRTFTSFVDVVPAPTSVSPKTISAVPPTSRAQPWSTSPTTAVRLSYFSASVPRHSPFYPAGSLVWFDPVAQQNVVYNLGDIAWVLASTALVWIMVPGVGYFYSGLLRRKNALSMIWLSMVILATVSFQVCPLALLSHTGPI